MIIKYNYFKITVILVADGLQEAYNILFLIPCGDKNRYQIIIIPRRTCEFWIRNKIEQRNSKSKDEEKENKVDQNHS